MKVAKQKRFDNNRSYLKGCETMKKRVVLLFVCCMLLVTSAQASGTQFRPYLNANEVPASVYQEPYMDSPTSTTYAPWFKTIHPRTQSEAERGLRGADAHQQIRAIAISPLNPQIMYFATDTSGIYASKNGGDTWYNTNNGYPGSRVHGLVCDTVDENTVYISFKDSGVARSTDGGKHWEEIIPYTDDGGANKGGILEVDAKGNLYAALSNGIWKFDKEKSEVIHLTPEYFDLTTKTGFDFRQIAVSADGQHICVAAVENAENLVTALSGIHISHDGGKTWTISGNSDKERFNCYSVAIHPENPMEIYFGGNYVDAASGTEITQSGKERAIYVSKDGGETWKHRYTHVYENAEEGVSPNPKHIYQLEFGPMNNNGVYDLYYCANESTYNLCVSHNYGETFERVHKPEDRLLEDTIYYLKDAKKVYTGYFYQAYALDMTRPGHLFFGAGGPHEYDNGVIVRKSVGFSGMAVNDIALNSQGEMFMCVVDTKGVYSQEGSKFDGETLPNIICGDFDGADDTFIKAVYDPNDDNHIIAYIGSANASPAVHGPRHSWDKGRTFEKMAEDAQVITRDYGNTKFLRYDPEDSNTIYTTYNYSNDNGKTWTLFEMPVIGMSVDCKRWLGAKGTGANMELYYSKDKGQTWEFIMKPGSGLAHIILDNEKDVAWLTRAWGLYKIDLESKTITTLNSKLNYDGYLGIAQNPNNPEHIIVSCQPRTTSDQNYKFIIAETRDGGENWNPIPGAYGGYSDTIIFLNDKVYYSGMSGTHQYDYKKYWEFLDSKITIIFDGEEIFFEEMPSIVNGRTMVPMRALFEKLGAKVNYDEKTNKITAQKGFNKIELTPGSNIAILNGEEVTLDAAPYITDKNRTMIPLRFVSQALEARIGWDKKTQTVYVNS